MFDSAWQIELAVRQLLGARIVYRIVSYGVHNSNGKSIGSAAPPQPTAEGPRATLSHNIAPSQGGYGPLSNSGFLGPTRVLNPNGLSIGSAVFAGLTSLTDRQTNRQTTLLGW